MAITILCCFWVFTHRQGGLEPKFQTSGHNKITVAYPNAAFRQFEYCLKQVHRIRTTVKRS